ncbi:Protein of unknown function DUF58 [Amphibacillus marinus]|uniref:DUF58 domain-containing protein n=1 Tax=Amphibacillus marinus TaxID=872970 RepID=A0A1H8L7I5_9BACI|nr:DUF58 domain-containing protein [Amphibacillus marinus]SEO01073.1 Protein of unknown function DUF58 [Amphibacillus marinus]
MRQWLKLLTKWVQLAVLFAALFSYAMFQGGFVSWFLFYASLPFLLYYLILLLYPIGKWQVKRIVPLEAIAAGQSVTIQLVLERRLPLPFPYLIVKEHLPSSLAVRFPKDNWPALLVDDLSKNRKLTVKQIVYPIFRKRLMFSYQLSQLPRGIHQFNDLELIVHDPFGFVSKETIVSTATELIVRPASLALVTNWTNRIQQLGDQASSSIQAVRSNVVTGAREYLPGDRVSSINWKATARTETLMTKEFDQEQNAEGAIVLIGAKESAGFEWNISASSSLLQYLARRNHQIDFFYIGSEQHYLSVKDKPETIVDVFTKLTTGRTMDWRTIRQKQLLFKASFIHLFTDHLSDGQVEQFKLLKRHVKHMTVYWTKAQAAQAKQEKLLAEQLRYIGVIVIEITESVLANDRWVVNI